MAKKTTIIEEGDRAHDEPAPPVDDSHIDREGNFEPGASGTPDSTGREGDEPKLVTVSVGGTTIEVSSEQAALIQAEQAASQDAIQQAQTLGEPAPREQDEVVPIEELLFTDPKAALEQLTAQITNTVRGEYQQDQSSKKFWDDFYIENPDLREEDHLVKAVLDRELGTLENMRGKVGRDKLAELTKGDILRITEKHQKGRKKKVDQTTQLEGTSTDGAPPPSPDNPPQEADSSRLPTLGDAIKQRKLNRARAGRADQPNLE